MINHLFTFSENTKKLCVNIAIIHLKCCLAFFYFAICTVFQCAYLGSNNLAHLYIHMRVTYIVNLLLLSSLNFDGAKLFKVEENTVIDDFRIQNLKIFM